MTAASLTQRRYYGARLSQVLMLAGMIFLGVLCGVLGTKGWILGAGFLAVAALVLVIAPLPLEWWTMMVVFYYLVENYVSTKVSTPISWSLLFAFLGACWWEQIRQRRPVEYVEPRLWTAILLWMGWGVFTGLFAVDYGEAAKELGRYALSFAMLLTYMNWLRTESQLRVMVKIWMVVTLLLGAIYTLEAVVNGFSHTAAEYPPLHSELGILFAVMIPVSLAFIFLGPQTRRLPMGIGTGIMIVAMIWSHSRSSYLAALVGTIIVLAYRFPRAIRRLVKAAGLAVLAAGLCALCNPAWARRLVYGLSGRDRVWSAAIQAIQQHPLVGVGPGGWSGWFGKNFTAVDFLLHDLDGNSFFLTPSELHGEAHNLFLTKAAEMGILSALGVVAILFFWFRAALPAVRSLPLGRVRVIAVGCMASMTGLAARCFFENGPIIGKARGVEIIMVWFVAVLPLVAHRMVTQPSETKPSS